MDLKELVELVERMREAQQAYFARRTQTDLVRARNLERQVDSRITAFRLKEERQAKQAEIAWPSKV